MTKRDFIRQYRRMPPISPHLPFPAGKFCPRTRRACPLSALLSRTSLL